MKYKSWCKADLMRNMAQVAPPSARPCASQEQESPASLPSESYERLHGFLARPATLTPLAHYIRKRVLPVIPTAGKKGNISRGELDAPDFKQTFTHGALHTISSHWDRARECNTSGKWSTQQEVNNAREQFLLRGRVMLLQPEVIPQMRKSLLMDERWQCEGKKKTGGGREMGVRAPCAYCKTNTYVDPTELGYTMQKWEHDPVFAEDLFDEIDLLS